MKVTSIWLCKALWHGLGSC